MAYKVPFIDYPKHYQNLKKELLDLFDDVLFTRADLILRGDLREFEKNFAEFMGVGYAVGVHSCTDAIFFSLHTAGIGAGDEVITVAHTFVATVSPIFHLGATPILLDVGEDFNMDVSQLEKAISPRTKAIIPVHLNGRLCDMEKIMDIASKYDLIVIEDSAQALGGTFDGKKGGTFGLAGCFSFFPAKILGAAGDGGIVITNDKDFADQIYLLRDHGRKTKEDIAFFGFNSRLDNLQAAILNMKLNYLPEWLKRRRELAGMYHNGLSDIQSIKLPPPPRSDGKYFDVYQNYVVRVPERDRFINYLRDECSIEILISWSKPMHHQDGLNLKHFKLPITEAISRDVVSLPINTELSNEQVEHVIDSIRKYYNK